MIGGCIFGVLCRKPVGSGAGGECYLAYADANLDIFFDFCIIDAGWMADGLWICMFFIHQQPALRVAGSAVVLRYMRTVGGVPCYSAAGVSAAGVSAAAASGAAAAGAVSALGAALRRERRVLVAVSFLSLSMASL